MAGKCIVEKESEEESLNLVIWWSVWMEKRLIKGCLRV